MLHGAWWVIKFARIVPSFILQSNEIILLLYSTASSHISHHIEIIFHKTGVINDPLGQTHSLTSREYCFRFVLLDFEKWGWTDGQRTKIVITTGRDVGRLIV